MAVWANWSHIFFWIHDILLADRANFNQMVDMNAVFTNRTIRFLKIKFAHDTAITVYF